MTITSEIEKIMIDQISSSRLIDSTEEISKEVRLSGSEEELRAFQYIKNQLDRLGFTTSITFHQAYISFPGKSSLDIEGERIPCITHSMAASVSGLESELIYIPEEKIGSILKEEVNGKILILDGVARPPIVKQMTALEVAGLIFINGTYTNEMIVSQVWGSPTLDMFSLLPTIPVVSVNRASGEHIKQIAKSGMKATLTTQVETKFRPIPTLIAELPGSEDPQSFVLFSGHIDSWHYGAMDNGTANAVMLEVARIIANGEQPKRTLRLAFWSGHSHGRYAGSAYYCDTHWGELEQHCVAHVNIDSVGAIGATVISEGSCMAETRQFARDIIGSLTGQTFNGKRFVRAGDQSFWGAGVPSLFISVSEQAQAEDPLVQSSPVVNPKKAGGLGWWWHTTEDTMDKVDSANLVRDCAIYLLSIKRLLDEPLLPLDQEAAAEEIVKQLGEWQTKAKEHFDLSQTIALAEKARNFSSQLRQETEKLDKSNRDKLTSVNHSIMRVSRFLVPLSYVKGSRFHHDLAVPQPALPKLMEIDQLIKVEYGSTEYYSIQISLLRNRNEIEYSLQQACLVIERVLGILQK